MQTDFLTKKRWIYRLFIPFIVIFVFTTFIYAKYLREIKCVWMGKSFYFLVSETEHVEAGSLGVKLEGGAGYLFDYDGRTWVVWAVYFNEQDGKTVQASTSFNGKETKLLEVSIDRLYLKSAWEKKHASLYENAMECLYGCIEVLGLEIERLDNGATQRSSMETLQILLKQLRYLSEFYKGEFSSYADMCVQAVKALESIIQEVIYTKDLRYLLCDLSCGFIKLSSKFSL